MTAHEQQPVASPPSRTSDCGQCRQCPITCDRVVYPSACVDSGCDRLYSETRHGRVVMGCAAGVFRAEIDVARFQLAQRSRFGFGALKVARAPFAICKTAVDEAFPHRAAGACRNPEFLLDEMRRTAMNLDPDQVAPSR